MFTTDELIKMCESKGIDVASLPDKKHDTMMEALLMASGGGSGGGLPGGDDEQYYISVYDPMDGTGQVISTNLTYEKVKQAIENKKMLNINVYQEQKNHGCQGISKALGLYAREVDWSALTIDLGMGNFALKSDDTIMLGQQYDASQGLG